ncbi:tetratricopeptide repeat protein [bacterium]|nr:tetratricopeptide repeat protein [bacterium]
MGYHLSAGRWMLENSSWPDTDTFTYTVRDHEYIDMHWLYQLTVFGVYKLGGDLLYVLFHASFILLAFLLAIRQGFIRNSSSHSLAILILLGAIASEHRFSVRPEVISWTLMMLTVTILEKHARLSKTKLYLLPIIMLIWVNIQGIFIVGLGIITCYLLDDLVRTRKFNYRFWFAGFASFFVTFINPYGWKGTLFPVILSNRLSGENRFSASIGEFLSPWSLSFPDPDLGTQYMLAAYYLLAILVPLLLLLTCKKRSLRDWLLTIMFGVLASQALRNIPLYFLIILPLAGESLTDIRSWLSRRLAHLKIMHLIKPVVLTVIILPITIMLNIFIINGNWHIYTKKYWVPGYKITNEFLPLDAVEFLNLNHIEGKILNELRHGGYLTWKWRQPVFIDGRLEVMQHEFYKEYEQAKRINSPWNLVAKWEPQIILFAYSVIPAWFQQFYYSQDWRLVYLDDNNVIFLHKDTYPDIPEITLESIFNNLVSEKPEFSSKILENGFDLCIPDTFSRFHAFFTGIPDDHKLYYNISTVMTLMNAPDYSGKLLKLALYASEGFHADSWYQLGKHSMSNRDYKTAKKYFDAAIILSPDHQRALIDRDRLKLLSENRIIHSPD